MEPCHAFIYGVACGLRQKHHTIKGSEELLPLVTAAGFVAQDGEPYRPGGKQAHRIFPLIKETYNPVKAERGMNEAGKVAEAFTDKNGKLPYDPDAGVVAT
jgi:hypothetical protein